MKIGIKELKSATGGKRWDGNRGEVGKGGQVAGKRTGFSRIETVLTRLFPHNSTQVVDFQRMYAVRVFLMVKEEPLRHGGTEARRQAENSEVAWTREIGGQRSTRPTRHVHIFGRVFVTERSLMFAYVRLKSLMFAYFEKKCFFPALWSPGIGTQWVGGKMVKGYWLKEVCRGMRVGGQAAARRTTTESRIWNS